MGWEDRPYYRERGGSAGGSLGWLLFGSVPLGTWFGIRVRVHVTLVIFMGMTLLFSEAKGGLGLTNAAVSMAILFFSVLLHEFGHCAGARLTGGTADDILMWPLGGLAFTAPPHRPWPSFITTACGPLVNLAICVVTGTAVAVLNHSPDAIPWFPVKEGLKSYVPHDSTTYYLWWIFLVNYALLVFNLLLLFYPFDGGRMVQELLWVRVGYHRSMVFATTTGMVGAAVAGLIGLVIGSLTLILIAGFGFYTCYRQRQVLRETGPYGFDDAVGAFGGVDYGASLRLTDAPRRATRRAARREQREREQVAAERDRIDQILAKVSAQGMHSLTWWEKRALHKATAAQRKRDFETRRVRR